MSNQKIEVNLSSSDKEYATLHILEGNLPEPENRKPICISGNINAPSEFWKKKEFKISRTR